MNQPDNHAYYRMRAESARDLAERAASPAIAAIHAEFATRYDLLAAGISPSNHGEWTDAQAA